jgi:hypothetical protein
MPNTKEPYRHREGGNRNVKHNAPVERILGWMRCRGEEIYNEKDKTTNNGEDVDDIAPELAEEEWRCSSAGTIDTDTVAMVNAAGYGNHVTR